MANVSAKIASGDKIDAEVEANNIGASFAQAYNPMGGSQSFGEALLPSAIQPFTDLRENRDWKGSKIRPEGFLYGVKTEDIPASLNYYSNLKKNLLGRMGISITEQMAKSGIEANPNDIKYLVEQYTGGVGKFVGKLGSSAMALASGKAPEAREVPFVSSFVKEREAKKYEEEVDGILPIVRTMNAMDMNGVEAENRRRVEFGRQADDMAKSLMNMSLEEQGRQIEALGESSAPMANAVIEKLEKMEYQLHDNARVLKSLPVKDGSRARAIASGLNNLSPEYIQRNLDYLRENKVLTREVEQQVYNLLEGQ
jgi:phage FluMu protein gp41